MGHALSIQTNPKLTTLDLPVLRAVGANGNGSVTLNDMAERTRVDLRSLDVVPLGLSLTRLGTTGHAPLTLRFDALTRVQSGLRIELSPALANLDGLAKLNTVTGAFIVTNNGGLQNADGLVALAMVGGGLTFQAESKLTSIDLRALTSLSGGGELTLNLYALPELVRVDARALAEIAGNVQIDHVATSADAPLVLAFPAPTAVRGQLSLNNVGTLVDLNGFANLNKVGGSLSVTNVSSLESAAGSERYAALALLYRSQLPQSSPPSISTRSPT